MIGGIINLRQPPTRPRTASREREEQHIKLPALLLPCVVVHFYSRLCRYRSLPPQALCVLPASHDDERTATRNVGHGDRGVARSKLAKVFKAPDASLSTRSAAASSARGTYMQSMGTKKSLHPMTIQQKIKLAEQRSRRPAWHIT